MRPKIGDVAPLFTATTADGRTISLQDYLGKKVVLYFYPMDDTPGCTKQACSLRDRNDEIRAKGAVTIGVSTQDQTSHQHFITKHKLNFPLIADTDKSICTAYGAMSGGGLKGIATRLLGLADRITFIIDEKGKIAHLIDDPDCSNHAEEVLKLL
jgi:peroxiredoxin Q/BCP